jgi:hypothetical protein
MMTFSSRSTAALAAALAFHCAQAQNTPQPAASSAGGLGDLLKQFGKSVDDAVKAGTQGAQGAVDGVNNAHAAVNGSVRGRVALQGGKTATCFTGIVSCYLGPATMTSPGQAQGVPVMLILPDGRAVPNNADQLAHFGVLVLPAPKANGKPDTGYRDPYGCVTPNMTGAEIARSRAVLECQTDAISERAWQRAQQRNDAARTADTPSQRQQAQKQLEEETKAKFEAIQKEAAKAGK